MTDSFELVFTEADLADLRVAKARLEYPSLTAKLANMVGGPLEAGFKLLPKNWNQKVGEATHSALLKGLEFSVRTLGKGDARKSQDWLHKVLVIGSGVAGGAAGPASLFFELPFSTCVMLRSIADIARSEGHSVSQLDVQLACLAVLALGGKSSKDDAADAGYWMVRGALAREVSEAASHLARKGLIERGAPPIVRLLTIIASRFSTVVTEQAAAKAVPILGALSGATINYLFMNHFQEMARGHFVVKRLEKRYGPELVEKVYRELVI